MGWEAKCRAHYAGEEGDGKAHLESKHLSFKGSFRFKIPFTEIRDYQVLKGRLELDTEQGPVALGLGSKLAERWYLKLRYPKSLIDKLGVKEDQRVSTVNLSDEDSSEFWRFLKARTGRISRESVQKNSDFIFFKAEAVEELDRLAELEKFLERTGSVWALWPKGQQHIKQSHVMDAAKKAGLVDVKIVSFSDRLSALKLMIPVARR